MLIIESFTKAHEPFLLSDRPSGLESRLVWASHLLPTRIFSPSDFCSAPLRLGKDYRRTSGGALCLTLAVGSPTGRDFTAQGMGRRYGKGKKESKASKHNNGIFVYLYIYIYIYIYI